MVERLGKRGYAQLERKARGFMKREDAIIEVMELLGAIKVS